MKTLHSAIRVADLSASCAFYTKLGYNEIGRTEAGGATLLMLKFPAEEVVSLELVNRPSDGPVDIGSGLSHVVVQVDDLTSTIERLSQAGLTPSPPGRPGGPKGPRTAWVTDPDGHRIELVEWPPGHPDGITADDFAQAP